MTYERLYELKFKKHIPTYQLGKRYPKELRKISRVALLELSTSLMRELVKRKEERRLLIRLKQVLCQAGSSSSKTPMLRNLS